MFIPSDRLPALPLAAARVLRVVNEPTATAAQVQQAVSCDVSLAGRLLVVANSAAFGFKRTLSSLPEAVVVLGLRRVRSIATALSLAPVFDERGGALAATPLWRHALGTALWSEALAQRFGYEPASEVFTAGLMHDIGLLILDALHPELLQQAVEESRRREIPLEQAEREVFGADHAEVGSKLCAKWRVPMRISKTILGHHTVLIPRLHTCELVALADGLARCSGWANFPFETREPEALDLEPFSGLGLDHDGVARVWNEHQADVGRELSAYGEVFGDPEPG